MTPEARGVRVFHCERRMNPARLALNIVLVLAGFAGMVFALVMAKTGWDRFGFGTGAIACAIAVRYWALDALPPASCEGPIERIAPSGGQAAHPGEGAHRWTIVCQGLWLRVHFRDPTDLGDLLKVGERAIVRYWRGSKYAAEVRALR